MRKKHFEVQGQIADVGCSLVSIGTGWFVSPEEATRIVTSKCTDAPWLLRAWAVEIDETGEGVLMTNADGEPRFNTFTLE